LTSFADGKALISTFLESAAREGGKVAVDGVYDAAKALFSKEKAGVAAEKAGAAAEEETRISVTCPVPQASGGSEPAKAIVINEAAAPKRRRGGKGGSLGKQVPCPSAKPGAVAALPPKF
jgi:hypothetical protein